MWGLASMGLALEDAVPVSIGKKIRVSIRFAEIIINHEMIFYLLDVQFWYL